MLQIALPDLLGGVFLVDGLLFYITCLDPIEISNQGQLQSQEPRRNTAAPPPAITWGPDPKSGCEVNPVGEKPPEKI